MFLKQNAVFGVLALVLFLTQTASMSVQYSGPMPTGRFPDAAMTPTGMDRARFSPQSAIPEDSSP